MQKYLLRCDRLRGIDNALVFGGFLGRRWTAFEEAQPPCRRVEGAVAAVKWRVDIVEEVPDWAISKCLRECKCATYCVPRQYRTSRLSARFRA
jgi:hypothetical protein